LPYGVVRHVVRPSESSSSMIMCSTETNRFAQSSKKEASVKTKQCLALRWRKARSKTKRIFGVVDHVIYKCGRLRKTDRTRTTTPSLRRVVASIAFFRPVGVVIAKTEALTVGRPYLEIVLNGITRVYDTQTSGLDCKARIQARRFWHMARSDGEKIAERAWVVTNRDKFHHSARSSR
jgi:hypothetical protein